MGRFLWGAFIGGVAGTFAALMLAKKTGKETRANIAKQYHVMKESGDRLVDDLTTAKQDLLARAKELAYDTKDTAKKILKDTKKNAGRKSATSHKSKSRSKR